MASIARLIFTRNLRFLRIMAGMAILDFTLSEKKAFTNGFLKGMAAPFFLYRSEQAPDIPPVTLVLVNPVSAQEALRRDWEAIGHDMSKVVDH